MYLHIGSDHIVMTKDIVGIFNIERTSVSEDTKNYLRSAAARGHEVSCTDDIPRSFIVTFDKINLDEKVHISRISPSTIEKRINNR
ncbi:protein of unknown function [Ruminococcus sp. YE71]|uniref:extracellular matrix regulator RemB n=1 Tax=unclassified Ruminococcus TaxID=2608920 RepID=UPI00088D1BC5|nr:MULTISPECIES: extracellular matrix/biofilm biosynthesis regulator RemA family protein [unclassified Ruminococcus]SDA31586.1 protein of unknown function [Ruminococcus sp. YE78]SFW52215.1 protein of unknown function [Ruminococcus sp. YE71]